MIDLSFLSGKKIGIVGLGKTGISAAKALRANGAEISAWDDNEAKRNEAIENGIALLNLELNRPDFLLWSPGIPHYGDRANVLAIRARNLNIPIICDIDLFAHAVSSDILAITGTNGKSTTTALVGHTLAEFRPTRIGGNIGQAVLTLDPLPQDGTYVLELSSYQLELAPSLRPIGAILLNITPDHLERHGGIDGYIAAKEKIFEGVHEGRRPIAVIAIDSDITKKIAARLREEGKWTVIPVSTQQKIPGGIFAESGKLYDGEQMVLDFSALPAFKGTHNHENAACAYALIRHVYGYEPLSIAQAMSSFQGLPHRQHLVRVINGISYVNDSKATNADAVSHALACTKNIYWILGGQPKEGGLAGLETYMDRIKHAFLIGEAAESFAKWLKTANVPFTMCGTLDAAVLEAHKLAQLNRGQPGEPATVLLSPACASWDQFQSFEHRGEVFAALVNALSEEQIAA